MHANCSSITHSHKNGYHLKLPFRSNKAFST
jgi:hypothetical protein